MLHAYVMTIYSIRHICINTIINDKI